MSLLKHSKGAGSPHFLCSVIIDKVTSVSILMMYLECVLVLFVLVCLKYVINADVVCVLVGCAFCVLHKLLLVSL